MEISNNTFNNKFIILIFFSIMLISSCTAVNRQYRTAANDPPGRIILNLTETPCKSQAVTWRTNHKDQSPKVEFIKLSGYPDFGKPLRAPAESIEKITMENKKFVFQYSAVLKNLEPGTDYSYRVGTEGNFSEWNQFRTAYNNHNSFKFVYLGDPQNKVKSRCSQVFRSAFKKAPDAAFWLFVGDLVNNGEKDNEWGKFFYGLGFVPRTTPMILLPGNHEYP